MADTSVVLPACPCPIRARLRRLAPAYTFTGCLLPQAYGKGDTARNEKWVRRTGQPNISCETSDANTGVGGGSTYGREDCLIQRRALLHNQLVDLLRQLRRGHFFGRLLRSDAN